MRAVVIVSDTVNRRFLPAYGNPWVRTPNLDRLQARSTIFENHWVGSAPCMPARRDLFTGRLNFLERNWGPIEPFDHTLCSVLKSAGIRSHIVTDHYHYLETGGEGYLQSFDTWRCHRGQESDPVLPGLKSPDIPRHLGEFRRQYAVNRSAFTNEEAFTTPRVFDDAAEFLRDNSDEDDFLLWVEAFDPHEPFDVPRKYLEMYDDEYTGPLYFWPDYAEVDVAEEAVQHVIKRYAASLTMMDAWLGKILEVLDSQSMWDDTVVVFTTDHGFMLGEHGLMGKNYVPGYNEVYHIPCMIHSPGQSGERRVDSLTQTVDVFPTLLEYFGVGLESCMNRIHGKSMKALAQGDEKPIRRHALYGVFGKSVNITDGRYTYSRAPVNENNAPLALHASTLTTLKHYFGIEHITDVKRIETGRFLKWTDFPVYRVPADNVLLANASMRFDRRSQYHASDMLFDISTDYRQEHPVQDSETEIQLKDELRRALKEHDAPDEQFKRLGLDE